MVQDMAAKFKECMIQFVLLFNSTLEWTKKSKKLAKLDHRNSMLKCLVDFT